jgi:hypothetical protein
MRLPLGTLVLAGTAAAACLLTPGPASAAPPQSSAMIRGAHLSPDTGNVDVYLTAFAGGSTTLWLASVGYGDVSPYNRLKPGLYAVSMRPHGAAASTPAALSWTFTAKADHAYTAAGIGMNAHLRGIILEDQLKAPAAGHASVRIIQAASRAPHADLAAQGGPVLARSAAFATSTPYTSVPAGTWRVDAKSDGTPAISTSAAVSIKSGSVDSVVLLDGKGTGITIRVLTDAAGAASTPIGSVPAGGGGTAARPAAGVPWRLDILVGTGVALAIAGLVGLTRGRRRAATR